MKFHILTLGCPKNEVDSEAMAQQLIAAGHQPADHVGDADALIVNTCGFIKQSRQESLQSLHKLAALKRRTSNRPIRLSNPGSQRNGKLLIAAGCLSERYRADLLNQVPELDGILGTLRWGEIADLISDVERGGHPCWTGEAAQDLSQARQTASPSAYLKIADGCDAACAFCAIPSIKGPQHSKPVATVIAEAQALAAQGVMELVLIAQDTTAYGRDLGETEGLANLLDALVGEVPSIPWMRLMYAHPAHVSDRLIATMARHAGIVKYLDLPLQHAHPEVLKRMHRPMNGQQVIQRLREAMPQVALRSSFIVGFPGETEREFETLLDFLDEVRLDRVGTFTYSREEGTPAASIEPQVPERVRRKRYDRAMERQQRISLAKNRELVGKQLDVLVEGQCEEANRTHGEVAYRAFGRSFRDAPEVDGIVFIRQPWSVGQIVRTRVVEALEYDLVAELS